MCFGRTHATQQQQQAQLHRKKGSGRRTRQVFLSSFPGLQARLLRDYENNDSHNHRRRRGSYITCTTRGVGEAHYSGRALELFIASHTNPLTRPGLADSRLPRHRAYCRWMLELSWRCFPLTLDQHVAILFCDSNSRDRCSCCCNIKHEGPPRL